MLTSRGEIARHAEIPNRKTRSGDIPDRVFYIPLCKRHYLSASAAAMIFMTSA